MKVLLTAPPNLSPVRAEIPLELDDEIGAIPSLGLMYIFQAVISRNKHEVSILDARIESLSRQEYFRKIIDYRPQLIGITTMSFTLNNVIDTVRFVNSELPGTLVCLGGPHVKYYTQETLSLKNVRIDYILKGEAEETFPQLLDRIEQGLPVDDIRGVGYKKSDGLFVSDEEGFISSLDSLNWPERSAIPYKNCYSILGDGELMTTIQTGRGCPYSCIYCDEAGSKYRRRKVSGVIDEIGHCVSLGIRDFFFIDDLFSVDRNWLYDFCGALRERALKIKFKISARVNTIDEEMLSMLKKAGCYRIHYGIESASQRVLDILKKKITLKEQEKALYLTRKSGIRTLCYFMIGSPGETREEILETIGYAVKLNPDYAHFSVTTPYPGTQLYKDGLMNNIFDSDFWREFAKDPSKDFQPQLYSLLPRNELDALQRYANKRFYARPSVFLKELLNTGSPRQFARKVRTGIKLLCPDLLASGKKG